MQAKTKVARARDGDIPELVEIWHQGWHQAHAAVVPPDLVALRTRSEFEMRTKAHLSGTHVLRIDDRIAGFFMLQDDELYQFYIAAGFQGQGIARRLMTAAEAEMGPGRKWLACAVGNTRAAGFYEALGWYRAATLPYDVETATGPQPVDVWRYEKVL